MSSHDFTSETIKKTLNPRKNMYNTLSRGVTYRYISRPPSSNFQRPKTIPKKNLFQMQNSSIVMTNFGKYVATVTSKEFDSMEQAQMFVQECGQIGRPKQDLRKVRPRLFDDFCEMLPEHTSSSEKRAQCKICVKLYGHVKGLTDSHIILKWKVDKITDPKERENKAASRHLNQLINTGKGQTSVKDLHNEFHLDPGKYENPAPLPKHQPLLPTFDERYASDFLCYDIETGNQYARDIRNMAVGASRAVIALQVDEPLSNGNIEDRANRIMRKHGVPEHTLNGEYIENTLDHFICQLPRDPLVDMAIKIFHEYYILGILKKPKNAGYLEAAKDYYQRALLDLNGLAKKMGISVQAMYQPSHLLTHGNENDFFRNITETTRHTKPSLSDYYDKEMKSSVCDSSTLFTYSSDDENRYFNVLEELYDKPSADECNEPTKKRKRGRPKK